MKVYILGAGKVGRALAAAARAADVEVTLRPRRRGLPRRRVDASLLVLAVRDTELAAVAEALAAEGCVGRETACVHVAGALDASVLAALRPVTAGVAQMHPLLAFAAEGRPPALRGGFAHVRGDAAAERRARAFARRLGLTPCTFPALDTVGYHAAAGLVANGAAALAALGAELLARSGVPANVAPAMLGPLLGSVASNVTHLGFPRALTGPVRRGDARAIERHLSTISTRLPEAVPLYLASAAAQLPLARALGEADEGAFQAVERTLAHAGAPPAGRAVVKRAPARRPPGPR